MVGVVTVFASRRLWVLNVDQICPHYCTLSGLFILLCVKGRVVVKLGG